MNNSNPYRRIVIGLVVLSLLGVSIFKVSAKEKVELISTIEAKTQTKVVLHQAVELNNSIKQEIERLRSEKLAKQENLERFIRESKKHKFKNYDIRTLTNLEAYQLEFFLEGTGLEGLGEGYAQAEKNHGVSAFVLIGISAHESSWGSSRFARERNNLFGYQAYDGNVNSARSFRTKEEGIDRVAKHLSENYLSDTGPYHKGYTLKDVNYHYASDEAWSTNIVTIMNKLIVNFE